VTGIGVQCILSGAGDNEFASPGCIVEKNRLPESGWLCGVNSAGTDISRRLGEMQPGVAAVPATCKNCSGFTLTGPDFTEIARSRAGPCIVAAGAFP